MNMILPGPDLISIFVSNSQHRYAVQPYHLAVFSKIIN